MAAWVALLGKKRTYEQLALMRSDVVKEFGGITEFTCDGCGARRTCEYAFDPYNTDGDCLAEK